MLLRQIRIDEAFDHRWVLGREGFNLAELVEEVAVGEVGGGLLFGGVGREKVPGGRQGVGEAREHIRGRDCALVLVTADLGVMHAGGSDAVGLREAGGDTTSPWPPSAPSNANGASTRPIRSARMIAVTLRNGLCSLRVERHSGYELSRYPRRVVDLLAHH